LQADQLPAYKKRIKKLLGIEKFPSSFKKQKLSTCKGCLKSRNPLTAKAAKELS